MYTKQLPSISILQDVAKTAGSFPISVRRMISNASQYDLKQDVIDFLHLFRPDEVFQNKTDFLTRCGDLEFLIQEEREMPVEYLRSPEG